MPSIPRLVVTAGEPAGIGPDLCLQLAANPPAWLSTVQWVVLANIEPLQQRAEQLQLNVDCRIFDPQDLSPTPANTLLIISLPLAASVQAGQLNPANSAYVIESLTRAIEGCTAGIFDAMITCPVHKAVINAAGIPFTGHTEFLAEQTHTDQVVMILATEGLRVALATTHIPLAQVSAAITEASLMRTLIILHDELQHRFAIVKPRILVCGLNPHAGEGGYLGMEEIEVITPVLERCRALGMQLTGPLPADTLFTAKYLDHADAVLAMYHDQGLPVLKYKGFGNAANITLGLPIVRTSVDHGTALELAGSGAANTGSLQTALQVALEMLHKAKLLAMNIKLDDNCT